MKTIGEYLRKARREEKMSLEALAFETKIKKSFLLAIEKEEWGKLPEFPVISGFVKNMASALNIDREQAVALLRRDYPPKNVPLAPNPEIKREFRLSPQLVFFAGVFVIIFGIVVYLVAQYAAFTRPPSLEINSPAENAEIFEREVSVSGKTDPSTSVVVNTQPALVLEDGSFNTVIEIDENTTTIEVVATSRAGKVTSQTRTIKPEFE